MSERNRLFCVRDLCRVHRKRKKLERMHSCLRRRRPCRRESTLSNLPWGPSLRNMMPSSRSGIGKLFRRRAEPNPGFVFLIQQFYQASRARVMKIRFEQPWRRSCGFHHSLNILSQPKKAVGLSRLPERSYAAATSAAPTVLATPPGSKERTRHRRNSVFVLSEAS